ncbi:MAG: hypothetical protein ACPG5T_02785, partial [Endozoicomonas sp.]
LSTKDDRNTSNATKCSNGGSVSGYSMIILRLRLFLSGSYWAKTERSVSGVKSTLFIHDKW